MTFFPPWMFKFGKENEQKQMGYKQVERDNRNFHHTVDATTDTYMKNALSKVRQSSVSLPDELIRRNGSWMHNRSFKK